MTRLRARRSPETEARSQALALRAASLLLAYPEPDLIERLPLLRAVADKQPPDVAAPLRRSFENVATTPLTQQQEDYTATFDLRWRCCLYPTYFSHANTRWRGMALLRFSHAYRSAGAEFIGGELPDHLAVVCEFAATADLQVGLRLLREIRAGLELVRTALAEADSPYVDPLDVVRAVLGEARPHDVDKALERARTGPPAEEVGLEPFGPPELMGGRR